MTLRLEAFSARKEDEALDASLAPWTTDVERPTPGVFAIGNDWSRALFDGDFYLSTLSSLAVGDLPSTSLVFVRSRNGNTGAKDPSTLGGGETDKHLIYEGLSRVAADAVMAGAETIRPGTMVLSVWRPELVALRASLGLPRHPTQIVATLKGLDLDGTLLFNEPDIRVVIITVPGCSTLMRQGIAERPWITPIVMPSPRDLRQAFHTLRRFGIQRVSCIGGRTLARQLIDAGLVQDLYLTTSAREGGEPNTPIHPKALKGDLVVRKKGTGSDRGVVFEHVRLSLG